MTSHPGFCVMLKMLFGDDSSAKAYQGALGKKISALSLTDNALHFTFSDGTGIKIFDDGQSCCENRYMVTDDDLSYFVGTNFVEAEIKEGPETTDEYGEPHEVQFLAVKTSNGEFTVSNHNEHNGYYGGFAVVVQDTTEGSQSSPRRNEP